MATDDYIRRTFDTLAERLRDEISRQLDEFSGPLAASLDEERADVNTRLAGALAEAADLRAVLDDVNNRLGGIQADADARVAEAVAETERRVADAEARLTEALAKEERLADAIRAMDRARSLSEILDTLASCARREAARVGVLLVRGSQLRAWRFMGFGPTLDEATPYDIPITDAGIIGDAVRSGAPVSRDGVSSGAQPSVPFFAELPPGRDAVALPMEMGGQVVAVLYADQAPRNDGDDVNDGDDADDIDNVDRADIAVSAVRSWPASLEVMSLHAARCLEAVTAHRSAEVQIKVLAERQAAPVASAAVASAADASFSAGSTGTPVDDEQAARRYARLLISEIKLYHEADVVAGRRERDLASRLGGEIARARVLYELRVPAHIRQSTDCFHDELVRTLADGDRELIA